MAKIAALRRHLNGSLFPLAPASAGFGAAEVAFVVALLAVGVVLQLFRVGWSTSLHSLWAEDGSVFLQGALTHGFVSDLVSPYQRYLVLAPRLIGEGAASLPLRDAPAGSSILAAIVVALSGLVVWFASAAHIRNPLLRAGLAVATVLVPFGDIDAVANATNVGWFMVFASFWALLWRPRSTRASVAGSAFLLVTALSTVAAWFLLPVAALRALAARGRADVLPLAAFGFGLAAQLPVQLLNSEAAPAASWSSDIFGAYVQRVVGSGILGQALAGEAWSRAGWALLGALAAAALIALVFAIARVSSRVRWVVLLACGTSLALFVASAYGRGVGALLLWPPGEAPQLSPRYAIVPGLLLVSAAVVLVDAWWRRSERRPNSAPVLATLAVIGVAIATSFSIGSARLRASTSWSDALASAGHACQTTGAHATRIPIAPVGWFVSLPCSTIAPHSSAPPRR